jgi:hypothetical protein
MRSLLVCALVALAAPAPAADYVSNYFPAIDIPGHDRAIRLDFFGIGDPIEFDSAPSYGEIVIPPEHWTTAPQALVIDQSNAAAFVAGDWGAFVDHYRATSYVGRIAAWSAGDSGLAAGTIEPVEPSQFFAPDFVEVRLLRNDTRFAFDWRFGGDFYDGPFNSPEPTAFALLIVGALHIVSLRRKR